MMILSNQYRYSYYKDKLVIRPSFLHNGYPYISKDGLYIETDPMSFAVDFDWAFFGNVGSHAFQGKS